MRNPLNQIHAVKFYFMLFYYHSLLLIFNKLLQVQNLRYQKFKDNSKAYKKSVKYI